jgi:hypothetical protein
MWHFALGTLLRTSKIQGFLVSESAMPAWYPIAGLVLSITLAFIGSSCKPGESVNGTSRSEVLELAARYLCPADPGLIRSELSAKNNSGITWSVWIGPESDDLFFEYTPIDEPVDLSTPASQAARDYAEFLPAECLIMPAS